MMSLISACLPFVIRVLDKYLDKKDGDLELKKSWLKFIIDMDSGENNSKRIQKEINKIIKKELKR